MKPQNINSKRHVSLENLHKLSHLNNKLIFPFQLVFEQTKKKLQRHINFFEKVKTEAIPNRADSDEEDEPRHQPYESKYSRGQRV